ncbi:DNA polymerase I [candidate division BRC1 bacterium HGW-BRC1-1]|jgi:DNA polymerase-1|nr:MAG: DNA polymerase I [candidate division BRC1 bacterium HGW-BRC1-1]
MKSEALYIVDGHSQVFKAYHAIQQLSNSKGVPTNAVFGFTQIMHRLLKTREPKRLVVTFDSHGPTFRHEMYDLYKANRSEAPEDLAQQMEYIVQILEGMRIPILRLQGYEADDIIATLVARARENDEDVVVVTADKDLFQLVDEHVRVLRLDPDKETEFDREAVLAKMGVYPDRILDLLAMVGDTSDNVPGIHKVGPKTAITLLQQFDTLEGVLANTDKLKGKQKENVENGRENALLSKRLVMLDAQVPLDFEMEAFDRQPPDVTVLADLYKELEFRRLLEELPVTRVECETIYSAVCDEDTLRRVCEELRAAGEFAIDTETTGLDPMRAGLVGISLSANPHHGYYIPIGHAARLDSFTPQLSLETVYAHLAPLLSDPAILKVGHNLKFDRRMLRNHGMELAGPMFDTLLASFLLSADRRNHGLKALAGDMLGITMTPITDLIGTGRNQISFADVDVDSAVKYASADADCTLQLYKVLAPRLVEAELQDLFEKIEMPLMDVLMEMEMAGVGIDADHFKSLSQEMQAELANLSEKIFALAGHPFNLSSPKQVAQVLFEELKLKPVKEKKTGWSTDVEVLEELAPQHDLPRLLLDFRQVEKLRGTYVDVLPTLVNPSTGRIHTTFNQTIAATGRLSSTDPNLQNIPVRTELGRRIREGFHPARPDNFLLSADYSQIELRVLAHVTGDPALVEAFRLEEDVHTLTASKVFGVALDAVTSEQRDKAKVVNFGIIYGISAHGLSTRLKMSMEDARRFIDEYFAAYSGVKSWVATTLESAREKGYVTTVSGRRRYLADINSRNFNARSAAERVAMNAPIQGTSADMIKIAMIEIHKWLSTSSLRTTMLMQVHDELIFDVPEGELKEVEATVREMMDNALPLDVPVKVETGWGRNWAEC